MAGYEIKCSNGELYHHGILGQKWGQRNGPPYPLGSGDHSAREEKAGWKKSLSKKSYKKISTPGEAKEIHRKNIDRIKNAYSDKDIRRNQFLNFEDDVYKKKLSDLDNGWTPEKKRKVAAIVLGVSAVSIAAIVAYKYYKSGSTKFPTPVRLEDVPATAFNPDGPLNSSTLSKGPALKGVTSAAFGKESDAIWYNNPIVANSYNTNNLFSRDEWNKLSILERQGVYTYTTSSYSNMNKYLRGLIPKSSLSSTEKLAINTAKSALDKAHLPEDVIAHRGTGLSSSDLHKLLGLPNDVISSPEKMKQVIDSGYSYVDPAFFSSGGSTKDAWGGVQLHAFLPKGAKAMYVDPISHFSGEHEFVAQMNSSYKITNILYDKFGNVTDLFVEWLE